MVNYNDGKWHSFDDYHGGVHDKSLVSVVTDLGDVTPQTPMEYAGLEFFQIGHGSTGRPVAFRVIKEHREPREFWVSKQTLFDLNGNISGYAYHQTSEKDGDFKVREVIE